MSLRLRFVALLGGMLGMAIASSSNADVAAGVDWPSFLARHDLLWRVPPGAKPGETPFLADGVMGTLLRQTGPTTLNFLVCHQEVEDRRDIPYGRARLPQGDLLLHTRGTITGADLRLSLWDAELKGTITTDAGTIALRTIVHATDPVIFIEIAPTAGERDCRWEYRPADAVNPRIWVQLGLPPGNFDAVDLQTVPMRNPKLRPDFLAYPKNPKPTRADEGGVATVRQQLENGEHATAWVEKTDGDARRVYVSTAYQWGQRDAGCTARAVDTVRRAAATPTESFFESHRAWWHAYYPKSFLTIADPYWETFYWVQLYKFACVTRAEASVLDNQGPWLVPTPWPATWWNLNVQLSYSLPFTPNHADVGDSLRRNIAQHRQNLIDSVPEQYRHDSAGVSRAAAHDLFPWSVISGRLLVEPPQEMGNLTWALHDVYLQYRMSMDDRILRDDIVPLLKRTMAFYAHFLTKGDDGRLHLPKTDSPEYGPGPDANYDLALIRWGLGTLLESDVTLKLNDPMRPEWQQTLDELVDYPQDANGYFIAAGLPYAKSHRHYSHLLMIYPLYLVNVENGGREIIEKSIAHWQSLPDGLLGYSFTGSASMYAALGDGDRALKQLNGLKPFLKPNSMYFEAGPVLETPFAACQSIHDMLLQSWPGPRGSVIRVFPAVPSAWPDAAFADWRAEGAFGVSASRVGGKTRWVKIESLAGEPCRVRPGFDAALEIDSGPAGLSLKDLGDGVYEIDLKKGQTVVLKPAGSDVRLDLKPIELPSPRHVFGMPANP